MMDIDRFKAINDELGHSAGDTTLCAVAAAIKTCIRESDVATRLGGDEFFVLLPDADAESAKLVVARMREAIRLLRPQTLGGHVFTVDVSIGQITHASADTTLADLLHDSDIVLYREKQVNRGVARQADGIPVTAVTGGAHVHPSNA
jgi:diguanylate cyclase (GGDEF)-like protein